MKTISARFLSSLLAFALANVVASGCDSRLLVGQNPDATGQAGTTGAAGSSAGGTAGTMGPPLVDGGALDAWIAFDSDGANHEDALFAVGRARLARGRGGR